MDGTIILTPEQVTALELGGKKLSEPVKKALNPLVINAARSYVREWAFGPTLMPTTKQRFMLYPSFAVILWMEKIRENSRN